MNEEDKFMMPLEVPFSCPQSMKEYVDKVLYQNEYEIPYEISKPVVLDLGANVGSFAVWALLKWPEAIVHCYEPIRTNFELLEANTKLFHPRIHLHNCAIGDPSRNRMFHGKWNCGQSSFFQLGEQTMDSEIVQSRPPSILPEADILKLDTEGCELEILKQLQDRKYSAIMLEYHSESDRRAIDQLLSKYVLVGSEAKRVDRGVVKYVHPSLLNQKATST